MRTFMQILLFIGFIVVIVLIFNIYVQFISKISLGSVRRRIEKGKINDKQLIRLYKTSNRLRSGKFIAIIMYGIFYKSLMNMQEATYQLYRGEMEKRGLLDQ